MYKLWRHELGILLLFATAMLLLYGIGKNWLYAIIAVFSVYIARLLWQLSRVYLWLKGGVLQGDAPDVGGFLGDIIHLIYQDKKAIEKSQAQQQVISNQFYETISAIPSATVILNEADEIEWASYPASSLLGISAHRDIGIKIDSLIRQPSFVSQIKSDSTEPFEMNSPVSDRIILTVQLVHYARQRRLLIAHDISSHIGVQRTRRTFVANASHELRTPLTVIAGYLEFMRADPYLPRSMIQPIDRSLEQSMNMQSLINDLLTLSRLEDQYLSPELLVRINVNQHLSTVLQTLKASGKLEQHKIKASAARGLFIEGVEKELNSVCFNLINNAIKYSEAGSKVVIKWEKESMDFVRFSVHDEGVGIDAKHISHLTERFYRVDSGRSRDIGGTGLGLSIVKHVLERHRGRLEVKSEPGVGSVFSAVFPIKPIPSIAVEDKPL